MIITIIIISILIIIYRFTLIASFFDSLFFKDAMGLPDPVAFAMLVALGAIPDPMALLNEMMAAAAPEDEKAVGFWKSPPTEAADSVELERLAKQAGTMTWTLFKRGRCPAVSGTLFLQLYKIQFVTSSSNSIIYWNFWLWHTENS